MAVMRDVVWHLERLTAPLPLTVLNLAFVRDQHLRSPNGSAEDAYISSLMATAYYAGERMTRRALAPQEWALVMDRFPCGDIVIPKAPLISVTSLVYIDSDGVEQTLDGSPSVYQVVKPSGPQAGRGRIRRGYDTSWPSTRAIPEAVTVTFRAGYVDGGSPELPDVPEEILHGMLLIIGELYKQRSESVHAFNQNPSLIRARDLFMGYRVY